MTIPKDVILDLLPLYVAGETSPATRLLVEEYLAGNPEFARRIRSHWESDLARGRAAELPPELELKSLRRTRRFLVAQKWLLGFAIGFTGTLLSFEFGIDHGRIARLHLLIWDHPAQFGICAVLAAACWIGHAVLRRRLRSTAV
jgi:hypothetical protein